MLQNKLGNNPRVAAQTKDLPTRMVRHSQKLGIGENSHSDSVGKIYFGI